jgi:hypothetical protein
MRKNSSSKAAHVIAFLKANTVEISFHEISKDNDRKVRRKRKIANVRIRKAS